MGLRWSAAGMLKAERQFRRIIGYRNLAVAIERDLAGDHSTTGPTKEARSRRSRLTDNSTRAAETIGSRHSDSVDPLAQWAIRLSWC
jgi:hypothetical protein